MLRCLAALSAALLLSGCVTTREYVYTNDPARAGYRERVYDDGDRYYSDGTYYSSSTGSSGDYYYSEPDYYGYSNSSYIDYPAYYSIFRPINSWWYDPFYYPNYYYGVTFFPRNYLSIGFGYGHGWAGWSSSPYYYRSFYSPYRYSWVDNYYDWEPWYRSSPRYRDYYPTPRYGNSRQEARRLASWSDSYHGYGSNPGGLPSGGRYNSGGRNQNPVANFGSARGNLRDADYGSRPVGRQDTGTRGFGVPTNGRVSGRDGGARGADYGSTGGRQIPSRGFGVPNTDGRSSGRDSGVRGADYGDTSGRQIPSRGFGVPNTDGRSSGRDGGVRGADYGDSSGRQIPSRGFGVPNDGRVTDRTQPRLERSGSRELPRADGLRGNPVPRSYDGGGTTRSRPAMPQRDADNRGYELPRTSAPRYTRPTGGNDGNVTRQAPPRQSRGYDTGGGGYALPAQQPRRYEAPVQQQAPRNYAPTPAPQRSYSAPAPAPSYSPPPAPARESFSAPPRESRSSSREATYERGPRDGGGRRSRDEP